jgi:carbon dioxide concentrating mechanism protein CcmL
MRLGAVIGKVTLNQQDPALRGGRFLLVQPLSRDQFATDALLPLPRTSTLVVYDALGAGLGQVIAFVEGAEASAPFEQPTPLDAYNAALVDKIFYTPPPQ